MANVIKPSAEAYAVTEILINFATAIIFRVVNNH